MNYLKTFIGAVLAGMAIAIGGLAFLSVDSKVLGSALFTVGLFTVCTMGLNLFTGKVCYVFQNDYVSIILIKRYLLLPFSQSTHQCPVPYML